MDRAELKRRDIRPKGIVLFDDVLTTGKHFECFARRMREALPDVPIFGIFVARCIHKDPFEDFDLPEGFERIR